MGKCTLMQISKTQTAMFISAKLIELLLKMNGSTLSKIILSEQTTPILSTAFPRPRINLSILKPPQEQLMKKKQKQFHHQYMLQKMKNLKKKLSVYLLLSRKTRWKQTLLHQLLNKSLQAEKRSSPKKFL